MNINHFKTKKVTLFWRSKRIEQITSIDSKSKLFTASSPKANGKEFLK
jgi:hypothetical protein